jgi:hypothetical protein
MVLGCLCGDRSSRQLITFSFERRPRLGARHRAGEHTRKRAKMLSAAYGVLAMVPVVFGVAGYVMVSR